MMPSSSGSGLRQHPLLTLEQLSAQCNEELQELRVLCDQVCSRLTVLVNHLEDATQRLEEPSATNQYAPSALEVETTWLTRVGEIIAQFSAFVDRNARHNAVRRLTDVYRLRELYELQIEIDSLFRSTRAEHVDVAQNWQFQWQKDVEYVEQQLQLAVNDQEVLCRELQTPDAQREALALVKFAVESTQSNNQEDVDDHDAQYAAARLSVLRKVFRALLSISEVDVPAIPEWFISPNDVATQKVRFVSGKLTNIHFGKWLPLNNQPVIVKRVTNQSVSASDEEFFMQEANLWYPLNHPNVLRMVGGCHASSPRLLVFERPVTTEIETLDEYISGPAANKRKLFRLLYQAALGLKYLHERHHIVHNDLKCRNILVTHDGKAKICNFFGNPNITSKTVNSTEKDLHLLNQTGSLRWIAPEALLGNDSIGFSADIYGFGMCILEAVSGDSPWGFADNKAIRQRVLRGELPTQPASMEDEVWALITRMCAFEPSARPDIAFVTELLRSLAEKESERDPSDSISTSRVNGATLNQRMSFVNPADYSKHHQQLSRSRGSFSETRSMSSASSSTFSKDEQRPADAVSVVTLHQKWLGVKINSIGTKIVISKFLRSPTGAMGEIEASGSVQLGDIIYAVNNQSVRGMNRHQIGSFIQSTPRPLQLSFKREAALLDDCFRFHGLRIEERWRNRGSALSLPGSLDRMLGSTTGCFSFETWFSLADAPDTFLGGILLGAQDSSIDDNSWPYIHRQVIVIDSHGNLCCSLLNTDSPTLIAKELVPNNWYHLVVTYNSNSQQLAVYLDGEMRHSASGPLHREWARLTYANIGSGCISGISPAKPSPDFAGWFGFNGLISDFKIWRALLTDLEVQQLFRGATDCVDIPSYSMKRDIRKKTMTSAQNPDRVRASRPQHVVAQIY